MRPGTLAVIIALLIALVVFGIFLITGDQGQSPRPSPTSVSPSAAS